MTGADTELGSGRADPLGAGPDEGLRASTSAIDASLGAHGGRDARCLFHLYRGQELLEDNRPDDARLELEAAVRMAPHDAHAQMLFATTLMRVGRYDEAIEVYEAVRASAPRDRALLANVAHCYLTTNQPDRARRDLEQLLALQPSDPRAWRYLGVACTRLGDAKAAERAFERAGPDPWITRFQIHDDSPTDEGAPGRAKSPEGPPLAGALARDSLLVFPSSRGVVIHPSGVALIRTSEDVGFAVRMDVVRASTSALASKPLERHVRGKATGEPFGRDDAFFALATGDGQMIVSARPNWRVDAFTLEDDICFVREEIFVGFDASLSFENGRLASADGNALGVVQLRGSGSVLLEASGEILTLAVATERSVTVRRDAVLGWFGHLVPRAVPEAEAPCGQRGLVSFAGEGRILVTSA